MTPCDYWETTRPTGSDASVYLIPDILRMICGALNAQIDAKGTSIHLPANDALQELGLAVRVSNQDIELIASNPNPNAYGVPDADIVSGIRLLARKEGLIADPVYEGRAICGLVNLINEGRFEKNAKVLLMHLGGSPAIHAYAGQFGEVQLEQFCVWFGKRFCESSRFIEVGRLGNTGMGINSRDVLSARVKKDAEAGAFVRCSLSVSSFVNSDFFNCYITGYLEDAP